MFDEARVAGPSELRDAGSVAGVGPLDCGLARVALGRPYSDEAKARFSGWGRGRADVLEELSEVPMSTPT